MANEKENPGNPGYRLQRRAPSLLKRQSLPAPSAQAQPALVRRPLRDKRNLREASGSARGGPKEPGSKCGDGLGAPGKRNSVPERRFSLDSAYARPYQKPPSREPVAMAAKGAEAPLKELTNRAQALEGAKEPSLEATFEVPSAEDNPRPAFFPALLGEDPEPQALDYSLPVALLRVEEAGAAAWGPLSPVSEHLRQVHEKLSRRRYFCEPSAGQPARRCLTPVLEELSLPEEEKAVPLDRICSLYRSFFAVECEGVVEQILSNPSSPAGRGGTPLLRGASAGGGLLSIELEPPPQGPGLADSVVEPPCGGLEASEMSEVSLLNLDELDMELVKLKQAGGEAGKGSEEPCSSPPRRSPVALLMERIQSLSSNAGSSLEGTFNVSDRVEGGQASEADSKEGSQCCREVGSPGAKANVTLILCPPSAAEPNSSMDPSEPAATPGRGAVNKNDTWELTLGGGEGKPAPSDSKDRVSVGNSFSSDVCPLLGDLDSILSTDDSLVRSHPLISSTPLAVPNVFNFHQRAASNPAPSQREAVKANSSVGSEEDGVPPPNDRPLNSTRASCAAPSGFPKPKPGTSTRRASLGGQPSGVAKNRRSLLPPPPPPPPPPATAKTGLQASCFSHPRMLDLPKPGPSRRLSLTYPSGPVGAAGSCPPSTVLRKPPRSAGKQLDGLPKPAARGQVPASSAGESSAGAPSSVLSRLSFGGRGERLSTAGNRLQASGLPKPAASGLKAPVSRRSALGPKAPGTQPGRGTAALSTANPRELLGAPGSEVPGSSSRVRPQTPKLARKTADDSLLPVAKRKKVDPVSSGIAVLKVPGSAGAPRGLRRPATRLSGRIPESRETGPPSSKGLQAGSALLTAPKLGLRPPSVCLSKRSKGAVPSADHGSATAQPQESEVSALSANVTFGANTPPAATPEMANKVAAQSRLDPQDPSPERATQDESSANVTFETARPAGPGTQDSVPSPPVNRTLDIGSPGRAGSLQEEPAGGAAASGAGPAPQSDSHAAPLQNDDSSPSANLTFEAGERAGSPVEKDPGVSSLDERAASPPDKSQGSASCSDCAESRRESRALLARCRSLEEQLKAGSAQCELYCQENKMLQERCRLLEEQLKAAFLKTCDASVTETPH